MHRRMDMNIVMKAALAVALYGCGAGIGAAEDGFRYVHFKDVAKQKPAAAPIQAAPVPAAKLELRWPWSTSEATRIACRQLDNLGISAESCPPYCPFPRTAEGYNV